MSKAKILVVDDEESLRFTFKTFLTAAGYVVETAESYEQAINSFVDTDFDLIVTDILLGEKTGVDLLREVNRRKMSCLVVMVTGYPDVNTATEAVRLGAFDYLAKPVREENLLKIAQIALQQKFLLDKKKKYRSHLRAIMRSVKDGIITFDTNMQIVSINSAAEKLFGLNKLEIATVRFDELSEVCAKKCAELVKQTIEQERPLEIKRFACQNFSKRIITINTAPLHKDETDFFGVVLVVRDETRLVDLETNLKQRQQYKKLVGKCTKMQELYSMLDNLKHVQTTVLVYGETGTGKELIVDALHYNSDDCTQPLVKVNCAALPENLLESELFGHVRGAFTGAIKDKVGRFQKAHGGTIMLDEISEISPRLQLRLLRVLQEKEFERVGDSRTIKVDVRIIAVTNQDLQEKVRQNTFREDLYYRLNVVQVNVAALREKRQDIPLLVNHFIVKFNKTFSKHIEGVSDEVQSFFLLYSWAGNIRELEHVLEHAFVVCRGLVIEVEHLPGNIKSCYIQLTQKTEGRRQKESNRIISALKESGWNKAKAARLLGISRQTIYRKIIELDIVPE